MLFWLLLGLVAGLGGTALWVQLPGLRPVALTGLCLASGLLVWLRLGQGWPGKEWIGLSLLFLALAGWYLSLTPRQDRDWASDVGHIVRGQVTGDIVRLQNIRDFRWHDATTAREAWTSRSLDLRQIEGADMITSVWGNPLIAHLLVSFRFKDQAPLTFSVEIRREKGESFSPLGGFFRQFELALIAASEDDILHWRAVARGEEVRLYPLALSPEQLRQVFLQYVALGNALNRAPAWYNTLTTNCTTVVWQLSKVLSPDLPLDPGLLLSGRLPEYLDRLGALAGEGTLAEKRARALISPKARAMPAGADFPAFIRE